MARIGIIGSGAIGSGLARLAVRAGHEVLLANSRGPETLASRVDELGDRAGAGTAEEAARFGDLTVLSIPLAAYAALPHAAFAGRTVLSTGNYYPHRDGRIAQLDSLERTTAEHEQALLPGAVIVKAFTNIVAHHLVPLSRPTGAAERSAMAIFADSPEAGARIAAIVDDLGFDPLAAGSLAESWRTEPESGAYTPIYAADPEVFSTDHLADPGAPLPTARLRAMIESSTRPDVAAREF